MVNEGVVRECATCNYPAVRPIIRAEFAEPSSFVSAVARGVLREKCGSLARSSIVLLF